MDDEGVLDPWAAEWLAANPYISAPLEELMPEVLELGRSPVGAPPTREIATVTDEVVDGVPIRIYQGTVPPRGSSSTFTEAVSLSEALGSWTMSLVNWPMVRERWSCRSSIALLPSIPIPPHSMTVRR